MANAASLTNFSSPSLDIGDWLYSIYPRSAPGYLPLNNGTASYLASSYPTLFGLLNSIYKVVPVNTAGVLPSAAQWGGALMAYGAGVYVAVGNGPCYSTDAITWVASTISETPRGIAYGAGVFAAHGSGTGSASSSTNGTTWTSRTGIASFNCWNMIYANSVFVAVGSDTAGLAGTVSATSTDGITWTARTIPSNIYGIVGQQALAYGAGLFVAFPSSGGTQTSYATSPDGITWTNRTAPSSSSAYIKTVAFGNGIFIGMCNACYWYTSTDGINWSTLNTSLPNYGNPSNIAFGDGVFVVTILGSSTALITTDAVTWKITTLASTSPSSLPFCIAYGGSGVFAVLNSSSAGGGSTAPITASKLVAAVSTTNFNLPVVTALTNTFTYVKAT